MPPERRGLALIVQSGAFDQVHYALSIAAAGAAIGRPATLFFTLGALPALMAGDGWRLLAGAEAEAVYHARGIAGFEELLGACRQLGVRIMACEAGLRLRDLGHGELRDDLGIEEGGLATLLLEAEAAQLIYV